MVLRLASSFASFPQSRWGLNPHFRPKRLSQFKRGYVERAQILSSSEDATVGLQVFVVSDLHTDYSENMEWVNCLSPTKYKKDVLLVAGDVAETYKNFVLTMSLLKDRFEHVLYVPGNHDLWCRRDS
ncbi:hypothetical protein SAY86_021692 [Trapa natans]|uniref:Calcineurin-like phosphoesterase domain-containing protein n=1 Tax=Trapa natans TaxID=22666 RepID=A0AAN7MSW1_TRANT|nr:hypothetical protein SAY86_021692 [Trapa natans]